MGVVDWKQFHELRADIGDEDFADVAMLFVAELSETLTGLAAAPTAAKASDFHFLRGSASNLGLISLVQACNAAEAACNAGDPADLAMVKAAFDAAIAEILPEMPELASVA